MMSARKFALFTVLAIPFFLVFYIAVRDMLYDHWQAAAIENSQRQVGLLRESLEREQWILRGQILRQWEDPTQSKSDEWPFQAIALLSSRNEDLRVLNLRKYADKDVENLLVKRDFRQAMIQRMGRFESFWWRQDDFNTFVIPLSEPLKAKAIQSEFDDESVFWEPIADEDSLWLVGFSVENLWRNFLRDLPGDSSFVWLVNDHAQRFSLNSTAERAGSGTPLSFIRQLVASPRIFHSGFLPGESESFFHFERAQESNLSLFWLQSRPVVAIWDIPLKWWLSGCFLVFIMTLGFVSLIIRSPKEQIKIPVQAKREDLEELPQIFEEPSAVDLEVQEEGQDDDFQNNEEWLNREEIQKQGLKEVQASLWTLLGHLELIKSESPSIPKRVSQIEEEARYLSELVSKMGYFHKSAEEREEKAPEVSIKTIIEEWVELHWRECAAAGVKISTKLEFEGGSTISQSVWFDVLNELLENSMRSFGGRQGRVIELTLEYSEGKGYLQFRDTGVGMTKLCLEKAFEPYYREFQVKTIGLGLSRVERLLSRAGASISIESTLGEGTEVRILFPVAWEKKGIEKDIDWEIENSEWAEEKEPFQVRVRSPRIQAE